MIELRSKDGLPLASLPWNGADKQVKWTSKVSGHVMGWRMLDKDGNVVASGAMEAFIEHGWNMKLDVDVLVDKVAMVLTHSLVLQFDPSKVVVTFNGITLKGIP